MRLMHTFGRFTRKEFMKTIIFILLMLSLNAMAETMNVAQAKQKIAEISAKQNKTPADILEFKAALKIVAGSFANQN